MNKLLNAGFVGVAAITLTATASGPKWTEGNDDAGSLPAGSQATVGNGMLSSINGNISATAQPGGMDFEDMFLINIVEPMKFRATTDPKDPELANGTANFDSQIWLFRPVTPGDTINALGFLGNDDHPDVPKSLLSLLIPVPTDGSPALTESGLYYIAITRSNNDPDSGDGEIFDQVFPFEISGPDGPGGIMMSPITGWTGDAGIFNGTYRIVLRGAEFAQPPCPGDVDNSGDVGVKDLLILLGNWGSCP